VRTCRWAWVGKKWEGNNQDAGNKKQDTRDNNQTRNNNQIQIIKQELTRIRLLISPKRCHSVIPV